MLRILVGLAGILTLALVDRLMGEDDLKLGALLVALGALWAFWAAPALIALGHARRAERDALLRGGPLRTAEGGKSYSWKSVRCVLNALLVAHRVRSSKQETLDRVLTRVRAVEPKVEACLRGMLPASEHQTVIPGLAHRVLLMVVHQILLDEPEMEHYVGAFLRQLRAPVLHFGGAAPAQTA